MDWFSFKGIRSDAMGLRLIERAEIPRAAERIKTEPIPGRDGVLTMTEADEPIFEPIDINLSVIVLPGADERAISSWLIGLGLLVLSTEPDKGYRCRISRQFSYARIARGMPHRKVGLTFSGEPFAYDAVNSVRTYESSPSSIINPGTWYSRPIMDVYADGDIMLTVGVGTMLITGVSDYIRLDSEARLALMAGLPATLRVTGDWPRLEPGANTIAWSGTVSKIELVPNWRWV